MGMILRIASSRIVGQGDIVGRSGYFSLNLSANSVMRGRLDARRTLKSLVADLRLIKKGIWRAYYLADRIENSLWFATPGDAAFSSWGYVDDKPSQVNIESVNDSTAYCISKAKLEALFAHSIEMANFGRKIFEREILSVDASTLAYGTPPTAKERYLTLMEENPELLQDVPLKYLASYLYITPQSLSRIRAGLREKEDVSK